MKNLIDSEALFALVVTEDANHQQAKTIFQKHLNSTDQFYISSLVKQETATVISFKRNHKASLLFLQKLAYLKHQLIWFDQSLETKTWHIFKHQSKKGTSFIDCANMAIYNIFKMDAIFSFDNLYHQNNIKTLS